MKKRIFLGLVVGLLLFQNLGLVSQAVRIVEVPAEQVEGVYNQAVDSNKMQEWPNGPHIYSESGIVMDADSGSVLYGKNIDDKHYPASITKVLTALVAVENCDLNSKVKHSWEDVNNLESGATHIGIKTDEAISMIDALHAILLASANEVSNGVASNYPGGYEAFIEKMNSTAKELGCENSNFMNPHGLHHDNHYTTAYDMALISAKAFQNETFRKITNTKQYTIPKTNITKIARPIHQKHKMLKSGAHHYEYCVGGKTGYTTKSLNTLVTFASKDGMNLVAVVIRTHGGNQNAYKDTRNMLDYAFENFEKMPIQVTELDGKDIVSMGEHASVTLPKGLTVEKLESVYTDPTELGDKIGTVSYTYNDWDMGEVEYVISDTKYKEIHNIKPLEAPEEIKEGQEKKSSKIPTALLVVLIILIVLFVAVAALFLYVGYKRRAIEKMRKERRKKMLEEWEKERE